MKFGTKTFLLALVMASELATASVKSEVLDYFKQIKQDNQKTLDSLQSQIADIMQDMQKLKVGSAPDKKKLDTLNGLIQTATHEREEYLLRQDFLDRLLFRIDNQLTNQPISDFLNTTLADMAKKDALDNNAPSPLWKFLSYASLVTRDLTEKNEKPAEVLVDYMKFATVRTPKPPQDYLTTRDYTNGAQSLPARPVPRENLGEVLDSKISELERQQAQDEQQKVFELRQPLLKEAVQYGTPASKPAASTPSEPTQTPQTTE